MYKFISKSNQIICWQECDCKKEKMNKRFFPKLSSFLEVMPHQKINLLLLLNLLLYTLEGSFSTNRLSHEFFLVIILNCFISIWCRYMIIASNVQSLYSHSEQSQKLLQKKYLLLSFRFSSFIQHFFSSLFVILFNRILFQFLISCESYSFLLNW